jgi:hypothetical protein
METRLQRGRRLLAALEDLASQEAVLVRSLDLVEALQLADRAAPLVTEVCGLAAEPDAAEIRPAVAALVERRRRSAVCLEEHLARVREELRRLDEARRRTARTAPAYRPIRETPAVESHLNTAA